MSRRKDRNAMLAGRTAKRLFGDIKAAHNKKLDTLLKLMFMQELTKEQQTTLAKVVKTEHVLLQIFQQLEMGEYHQAEELINTKLFLEE